MRRLVPVFLAALAVVPSTASADWTPATDLTARGGTWGSAKVVAGADGSALVGFERDGHVFAALKPSGAPIGAVTDLGAGSKLSIAMAPSGRAVAAWSGSDTSPGLHIAIREPGAALAETAFTSAAAITSVSASIAGDGRAFVGSATQTTASLVAVSTGSSARTPLATFTAQGVEQVAVASQPTGDKAWLAVHAVPEGELPGLKVVPWQSATGAGAPQSLTLPGTDPVLGSLRAVDGSRPSFFWTTTETAPGFPPSTSITLSRTEPGNAPETTTDVEHLPGQAFSVQKVGNVSSAVGSDGTTSVAWPASTTFESWASISTRPGPGAAFGSPARFTGDAAPATASALRDLAIAPAVAPHTTVVELFGTRAFAGTVDASGATIGLTSQLTTTPGDSQETLSAAGTGFGETIAAWLATGADDQTTLQLTWKDEVAPALSISSDTPGTPSAGQSLAFSAVAVDRFSTTGAVSWDFGDGTTATGKAVSHVFAAGAHTVTATVADAVGNVATKSLAFTIPGPATAPTPTPAPTLSPGAGAADGAKAATLTGLKLSASSFAVTKGKPTKGKGTTIAFTLSAAAKVELSVDTLVKGYASGKKCVAKKPKGDGSKKRCWIRKKVGLAGVPSAVAGVNRIPFDGTVAGKALKPGTYQLIAAPIAPLQSHGTAGLTVKFTIKR